MIPLPEKYECNPIVASSMELAIPNGEPAGDLYTPVLQAHKESKAADWEIAIHGARGDAVGVSTDGSMDEKGDVGVGWYIEGAAGREG